MKEDDSEALNFRLLSLFCPCSSSPFPAASSSPTPISCSSCSCASFPCRNTLEFRKDTRGGKREEATPKEGGTWGRRGRGRVARPGTTIGEEVEVDTAEPIRGRG